jgi:hypothetical protein
VKFIINLIKRTPLVISNLLWGFTVLSLINTFIPDVFDLYAKYQALSFLVIIPLDIIFRGTILSGFNFLNRKCLYLFLLSIFLFSVISFLENSILPLIIFAGISLQNIILYHIYYSSHGDKLKRFEFIKLFFLVLGILFKNPILILIGPIISSVEYFIIYNKKNDLPLKIFYKKNKTIFYDKAILKSIGVSSLLIFMINYLDQLIMSIIYSDSSNLILIIVSLKLLTFIKVLTRKTVELTNDLFTSINRFRVFIVLINILFIIFINLIYYLKLLDIINLKINSLLFFNSAAFLLMLNMNFSPIWFRLGLNEGVKEIYLHDILQIFVFLTLFPFLLYFGEYGYHLTYILSFLTSTLFIKMKLNGKYAL